MSRFKPHLVHAVTSAAFVNQMSHANGFGLARLAPSGGRGRSLSARRRVQVPSTLPDRDGFLRFWSGLMLRHCGSAAAVSQLFLVTEQTGRNWIDGFACPTGVAVDQAMAMWPEEFRARHASALDAA